LTREFEDYHHAGDYKLLMFGMSPKALSRKSGKVLILDRLIVPLPCSLNIICSSVIAPLALHYILGIAIFFLSSRRTSILDRSVLELVRVHLETVKNRDYLKISRLVSTDTD
jgi:hypothetical protein